MISLTLSFLLDTGLIPVFFFFGRYFIEFMYLSPFPLSGSFPSDKFPAVGITRPQSIKRFHSSWNVLPVSSRRNGTSFYCRQQCAMVYTLTVSLPALAFKNYSSTGISMWLQRKSKSHWGFSKNLITISIPIRQSYGSSLHSLPRQPPRHPPCTASLQSSC